jgi:hypothetical protein
METSWSTWHGGTGRLGPTVFGNMYGLFVRISHKTAPVELKLRKKYFIQLLVYFYVRLTKRLHITVSQFTHNR